MTEQAPQQEVAEEAATESQEMAPKKRRWSRLRGLMARVRGFAMRHGAWVLAALILLVIVDLVYGAWELSYNPGFCRICHIVRPYVDSYETSSHLDSLHREAGVLCKECHHVSPFEAISEVVSYITFDYETPMAPMTYGMEDCLECHRSYESLVERTAHLEPNPHNSHFGEIECTLCHHSHQEAELLCDQCHEWDLDPK